MTGGHVLDIPTFLAHLPKESYKALGDDFFVARLTYDKTMDFMKYPVRFNGFLVFFCQEGSFNIDINMRSYKVCEGSLIIYTPGNIVRVTEADSDELKKLTFVLVASSEMFITDVKVDFSKLYEDSLMALENPCIILNQEERKLLKGYFSLTDSLLAADVENVDKAVKYLGTSVFYLMGSIWKNRIDAVGPISQPRTVRAALVYETFLKLVAEYHSKERNIIFYADKLYLTPKYLSKLVKNVSGRTAADWINGFVVLDVKNLLKYSDLSIKEIAFKMNFSSVPAFYKFFTRETGMTPLEYREQ